MANGGDNAPAAGIRALFSDELQDTYAVGGRPELRGLLARREVTQRSVRHHRTASGSADWLTSHTNRRPSSRSSTSAPTCGVSTVTGRATPASSANAAYSRWVRSGLTRAVRAAMCSSGYVAGTLRPRPVSWTRSEGTAVRVGGDHAGTPGDDGEVRAGVLVARHREPQGLPRCQRAEVLRERHLQSVVLDGLRHPVRELQLDPEQG
jgi:hypothetical protein